jgi:hypothetical protein
MSRITPRHRILALAVATLFAAPALAGPEDDVRAQLAAKGYSAVHELEYESGLWDAEVTRADGTRGEVSVDDKGEVYDGKDGRTLLDADGFRAKLAAAGYSDVRDVERDGAIWSADANDAQGQRMELRASAYDGHVISATRDDDD